MLPSWLEDVNAYDQNTDEDMMTVVYTIILNLLVFGICILIFSFTRRSKPSIYCPKQFLKAEKTPKMLENKTSFGWILELYHIDDQTIVRNAGYDVLLFIRFYRLSFKIFFYFALYAWGVLLPINGSVNMNFARKFIKQSLGLEIQLTT